MARTEGWDRPWRRRSEEEEEEERPAAERKAPLAPSGKREERRDAAPPEQARPWWREPPAAGAGLAPSGKRETEKRRPQARPWLQRRLPWEAPAAVRQAGRLFEEVTGGRPTERRRGGASALPWAEQAAQAALPAAEAVARLGQAMSLRPVLERALGRERATGGVRAEAEAPSVWERIRRGAARMLGEPAEGERQEAARALVEGARRPVVEQWAGVAGLPWQMAREMAGVAGVPATGELAEQEVRRAWAELGAPKEEARLPGALQRVGEVFGETPGYRRVGERTYAPGQKTPEQAREEAGALLGLAGAAWHDIKQAPVVGKPARALEAGAETLLAGLQAITRVPEELLSYRVGQRLEGGKGLPPLAPGRHLTEEQKAHAATIAEQTGMPLYAAQQGVLLRARIGQPGIREYTVETYGPGPEAEQALHRLAAVGGYSSYEAQQKMIDRLMAGEDVATVAGGRRVDIEESEEDLAAAQAYVAGIREREGEDAAQAAAQQVWQTGYIPGDSDPGNQLLFEFGLDPLNALDFVQLKRGYQAMRGRALARTELAAHADELADGTMLVMRHGEDAAQLMGKADEAERIGGLRQVWEKVNPLAPTPRAEAERLAGAAYQVASPAVWEVGSAEEARAVVRGLVEDPGAIARAVPVAGSELAEEARPLLAAVLEDLDDTTQFKSLAAGGEFRRERFLAELDTAMMGKALERTGASAETANAYKRWADGYRDAMSKFYLRTPGYAIRNASGDLVTMAWDGLLTFDGRGQIDDFMTRFGPTTRRVSEGIAGGPQTLAVTGEQRGLVGAMEKVTGPAGRVIQRQEEGRYLRAHYGGLKRFLRREWTPRLPDSLRGLLGEGSARAVESGLARGVNRDEFVDVIRRATGEADGRLVDVGRYLDDPDQISVGMRLQLETELAGAETAEDVDRVMEGARAAVGEKAGRAFAADPTPPGRRVWTEMESVQDLAEEQGWLAALGNKAGLGEDQIAQGERALAEALRPGEARLRAATEELVRQVGAGGIDEESANLVRVVRSETATLKMEARATADGLRAEAWRLIDEGQPGERVWGRYFQEVPGVHLDAQTAALARMEEGVQQLKRLQGGEDWASVVGRPMEQVVDESLEGLRALAGELKGRSERLRRLGLEDFGDFDKTLDAQRLAIDTAEAEAWRLVVQNPTVDGIDIVMSTQDGVDRLARAAAAEVAEARGMMLAGRMSKQKYAELASDVWNGFFRNGSQGWDLARWELAQLPLSPRAQQRALQGLGWPVEEAAKLGAEEIKAVLGRGVAWDPLLGGPTVRVEDAMRGTLAEVAQRTGLDLNRSADWTPAQWEGIALTAEGMAQEAGGRASAAARVGRGAAEVAVEAAEAAPQTVRAGMDVQWPASVDDVARSMGIRPQAAGPEEWAAVAGYAGQRAGESAAEIAGRWAEMAEEAGARAAGRPLIPVAPGLYDAAGFPATRARGARRVGMRRAVERGEALVPEGVRLGRGRAMVGFEMEQAGLAAQYEDVARTARARKGLAEQGRRVGEVLDVPVGVVGVSTRREAGIYLLDLADEQKRVVRSYSFDTWPEVRKAREEARGIIAAGQQGQASTVGTAWAHWRTDDVMEADRRAFAAGGYVEPPTMADAARVIEDQELGALERIGEGYKADLAGGAAAGPGVVPQTVGRELMRWLDEGLMPEWQRVRAGAVEYARQAADFSLLDYTGGRKRFDNWLQYAFPYTYWKTRSGRNWLVRFAQKPGALAGIARYQDAVERGHEEKGYRERLKGKVEVPAGFLPEWTGRAAFVDPAALMPWATILGPDWVEDPDEAESALEAVWLVSQKMGLRPYGFIEWPMRLAETAGLEAEETGYLLPHTGAIQAATALAGVGPPGGVSVEAPLRRGLGLPEQEPYQTYRQERMLSNMAAETLEGRARSEQDPGFVQRALMASELARLVETGDLRLVEAMGWGEAAGSERVMRIARDNGWSEAQVAEAQALLQEAVDRAAKERGIPQLSSFLLGYGVSIYPEGERRQVELSREQRGAMYSPLTGEGGREELQAWRAEHPETIVRQVARAGLPGAGEYEGWTPGEAWQSQEYGRRSDEINERYDRAADALLRREPWNREGVQALEDQRQAELEAARGETIARGEEAGGVAGEAAPYRPRSTYGAGPEEAAAIRREEVLAAVSNAMPKVDEFRDAETGEVDYDAYERARETFFADLPGRMAGDERLAAISQAMAEEVGGVAGAAAAGGGGGGRGAEPAVGAERVAGPAGLVRGVSLEDVQAYWRRNDRPLEAAQRVWQESVYGAAWDAYNRAVEKGATKGDAYARYIEGAGETKAETLIDRVMEMYPDRWTREELEEALGDVTFPSPGEVRTLRLPEEEQALERAKGAFWDFYNQQLPPGRMAQGAREHTLVQLLLDAETRGTATAEQYAQALEKLEDWKAANFDRETWGTPEDWAEARRLNEEFDALVAEYLPGVDELLDRYYELPQAQRKAFKAKHPEIGEYYDLRDWFGAQAGHEVWAYYYLSKTGGAATGQGYARRRYYGGRGRGGYGGYDPFAYQARRVPKVYLETPSAWRGSLWKRDQPWIKRKLPFW